MTVISYDPNKGCWVDINGKRPDIKINPDNKNDYFYYLDKPELILHCYSEPILLSDPLGEIINRNGKRIKSIPPLITITGVEKHFSKNSFNNISWISDEDDNLVSFVIDTSSKKLMRVFFNFKKLEYTEKITDAR